MREAPLPDDTPSALRRMLKPRSAAAGPTLEAIENVLELALPREADANFGLTLSLIRLEAESVPRDKLLKRLKDSDLIFRMESEGGHTGLCWIDMALLSALVEVQTTGRLTSNVTERKPTRIDAIIAEDLIDAWIFGAMAQAREQGQLDLLPFAGFDRQAGNLAPRGADLVLDLVDFSVLTVTLDIGNGVKNGLFMLATPERAHLSTGGRRGDGTIWDRVKRTPTPLHATLPPMRKPARFVAELAEGDVLEIPPEALRDVRIDVRSGETIAHARLGHAHGQRAVRLSGKVEHGPLELGAFEAARLTTQSEAEAPDLTETSDQGEEPGAEDDLPDLPPLDAADEGARAEP